MKKKFMWMTVIFLWIVLITGSCYALSDIYDHKVEVENVVFEWKLAGENIHIRLAAKTEAWVGIGFNPSTRMKDANFIIGYVKEGKVKITDHYGTAERQHQEDTRLGGQKNIQDIGGKEENGVTEIIFSLPLDSKDSKDQPIWTDKDNTVLFAYGAGRDSFRTKHQFRAALKINMSTGKFSILKQSR
jgi:hypothetical protein